MAVVFLPERIHLWFREGLSNPDLSTILDFLLKKQEKGTAIAKDFQRLTLDMDKPTKSKDFQGFIEAQKKGASYFQDFIDLLSDVPDEL